MITSTRLINRILFLLIIFSFSTAFAQEIIEVSENGPYYTLEEAYNAIEVNSDNEITHSYIIELSGNEIDLLNENISNPTPPNQKSINWKKSGTHNLSIKIISNEGTIINKPFSHRVAILLQSLYSSYGQFIKQLINKKLDSGRHLLNFKRENLDSGIYILKYSNGNINYNHKIVINNN